MMILTPSRVGKSMESDCVGSLVIIAASEDLAELVFEASAVFSPPWEALAMVMLLLMVLTGPIFEASTVLSPSCGG